MITTCPSALLLRIMHTRLSLFSSADDAMASAYRHNCDSIRNDESDDNGDGNGDDDDDEKRNARKGLWR